MKLILGLGNPGLKYAQTRHNLGANALIRLASLMGVRLSHTTMHAEWGRGVLEGEACILACPLTYMNCSGQAVSALNRYFKLSQERMLILSDDFHLPLGCLRFRAQGSAGGHNGLKSIIDKTGTQAFHRLRIGIGNPPPYMEITDYVLGRFSREEIPQVKETITRAAEAAKCWLAKGIAPAMREFN